MRLSTAFALVVSLAANVAFAGAPPRQSLPAVAEGWSIELVAEAPRILFPTAIVAAPDGTIYLGSDPMDMPGPPTQPIDRILALKGDKTTVFANKLWSVMGLEWIDHTLYVVHAPFLSALRDRDGDGTADERIDLMTGLGPKLPGFNGINDHIASGIRLGMDGFLYISVGDKGIPGGVGRDGTKIQLHGGGVIRIRPDGSGLEVVSTGERNPLSVALTATDEIFTYGNDDDGKRWPNSLTHHIVGAHFGYPYQFLTAPHRTLPIVTGRFGGSGTQGFCYNEDGLPAAYRGNVFFCDWGLQTVDRFELKKNGGTFSLVKRSPLVTSGGVSDFRPFSIVASADGTSLWLVDWAHTGWLTAGIESGRLFRLTYTGADRVTPANRPAGDDLADRLAALDHPALAVRLESQRIMAHAGIKAVPLLTTRLKKAEPEVGRLHAIWALDAIGGADARAAIGSALTDASPRVRLQAVRSMGIRGDASAGASLIPLLKDRDPAVRREAAIALGKLDPAGSLPDLYAALGDSDTFAAWSIRQAIRRGARWDKSQLISALSDDRRLDSALKLTDEAWSIQVVQALTEVLKRTASPAIRQRIVGNLSGLYQTYPDWTGEWFGTNPLAGPFPERNKDWDKSGMRAVLVGLATGLSDPDRAVRGQAIAGLGQAGQSSDALFLLRTSLTKEADPDNQAGIAQILGAREDVTAAPILTALLVDSARPERVRLAALGAMARFRDPQSLRGRLTLIYDPTAPEKLAAQALHDLATGGFLPTNDVASFFENASPAVRSAALLSLNVKKALPDYLEQAVVDRLGDKTAEVRQAAIMAIGALKLRAAIPALLALANDSKAAERDLAAQALCEMPDARATTVYLSALENPNPVYRRTAESALLAIRDGIGPQLEDAASSGTRSGPAAASLERIRARFEPVRDWTVIGPFPRTTPPVFISQARIDFGQTHVGAEGRTIRWQPRTADQLSGRVALADYTEGAGDRGGFGYDKSNSPDLCAFAYAQIPSDRDTSALMLVGSSGKMLVTVNEVSVYQYSGTAGRPFAPDSDLVRLRLSRGANRILAVSRQGIGAWSFSVQIARSDSGPVAGARSSGPGNIEKFRRYAMDHSGDPARGRQLFFENAAIGCVRCHSAGGRGTATIGPDLTGLASKYDRAELIRSVLEPSNRIALGYQPTVIATTRGQVISGVVRRETSAIIELAGSDGLLLRLPRSEINQRTIGDVSVMPTGLTEALKLEEFADLIAYLSTLRHDYDPAAKPAAHTMP